jgi:uncharacterized surface protein with fasciclin (FAS1) repeats
MKASILLFSLLVAASGCQENYEELLPSIALVAVANQDFQLLEAAAVRGGVAVVLSNKNPNDPQGNYTVFAPTNAAFAKLGFQAAEDLAVLQKPFLTNTLLYHVSNGSKNGASLNAGQALPSLLSVDRRIVIRGNDRYINGSKIIATDVLADNGIIHVIDRVLLATGADIVQSAIALSNADVFIVPELTFLVEAVIYAELAEALSAKPGSPSFTVFAPTDQAFRDLGAALGITMEKPSDIRQLPKPLVAAVLLNHVLADGGKFSSELNQGARMTLGGTALNLDAFVDGFFTIRGAGNDQAANLVIPDVQTINGVVHVIDRVLLP